MSNSNDQILNDPLEFADNDQVSTTKENVEILQINQTPTNIPPRILPTEVKTEEQALQYFIGEVRRRYRLNQYENIMEQLENLEIEDGILDALEEINQTIPITQYTLLHLVNLGTRYRRLLILGAAKNSLLNLVSIWASNGINVTIEDLGVDNKYGDMTELRNALKEEFNERLEQLKTYDKLAVSQSYFHTGLRRYSRVATFGWRVWNIIGRGGRIG